MPSRSVVAFKAGTAAARILPDGVVRSLAHVAGVNAARLPFPGLRRRRFMVERHLQRVYGGELAGPTLHRLVADVFASYALYWAESFQLPSVAGPDLDTRLDLENGAYIDEALGRGRGAILALPHLGGWEWGGAFLANRGQPPMVVVEPLQPPELFVWFTGLRRRLGMEVVPADERAASTVVSALRANRVVCLLSDRSIEPGTGVEVEFFGERTTLPGGPATLALRTGAALLPAAVYFSPAGAHRGVVRPALAVEKTGKLRWDIARITQALAEELEELIKAAPTQWHLMSPNWPSDYERRPGEDDAGGRRRTDTGRRSGR